jgi:hypothetical protein
MSGVLLQQYIAGSRRDGRGALIASTNQGTAAREFYTSTTTVYLRGGG